MKSLVSNDESLFLLVRAGAELELETRLDLRLPRRRSWDETETDVERGGKDSTHVTKGQFFFLVLG